MMLVAALASATVPSLVRGKGAVAGLLQVQDTLTGHFVDSVVVESPLPDPLVPIIQWIFQKPGWLMAGGIVIGGIVAAVAVTLLWRHRQAIGTWLVTRDRGVKIAMLAA